MFQRIMKSEPLVRSTRHTADHADTAREPEKKAHQKGT